jgi:hypothetical protein
VGTAEELWAELEPILPRILRKAPHSILDLANCMESPKRDRIAWIAFTLLRRRFGESTAEQWRNDVYLRGHLVKKIRLRLASEADNEKSRRALQDVGVVTEPNKEIRLEVPDTLIRRLNDKNQILSEMQAAADSFELHVRDISPIDGDDAEQPPMSRRLAWQLTLYGGIVSAVNWGKEFRRKLASLRELSTMQRPALLEVLDASILLWCGRLTCGAFFISSINHLVPPPPVSTERGIEAAFICMPGIIILTITVAISFLLNMLFIKSAAAVKRFKP